MTLDILARQKGSIELDDLARELVEREDGDPLDREVVERVAGRLHHVHLPKMSDLGLVDYDEGIGRVDPVPGRTLG